MIGTLIAMAILLRKAQPVVTATMPNGATLRETMLVKAGRMRLVLD